MATLESIAAGVKAISTIAGGYAEQSAAKSDAKQLRQMALRAEAISQREAIEELRNARLLASRARAVAGASGAGVDDPSVVGITNEIEARGEYNFLVALYEGKMEGRQYRHQASVRKEEGKQAVTAAWINTIADAGMSMASSGFGKKPKANVGEVGGGVQYMRMPDRYGRI